MGWHTGAVALKSNVVFAHELKKEIWFIWHFSFSLLKFIEGKHM